MLRLLLALALLAVATPAGAQNAPAASAALLARIQQLEEDMRRLTGRLEELEFAQRRLESRQDEAAAASPPPVATAPPEVAPSAEAPPPTAAVEPDAAARRGYVLGTVPEGTLRDRPATPPAADGYEAGLDYLQAARWAEAEQAFAAFVQENADDPRAAVASYWLGETHLLRKDYQTAAAVFARNYRSYGDAAPRAPDNLLKLGVALAAMGERDKACQSFAELTRRHPNAAAPIRQELSRRSAAAGCG